MSVLLMMVMIWLVVMDRVESAILHSKIAKNVLNCILLLDLILMFICK